MTTDHPSQEASQVPAVPIAPRRTEVDEKLARVRGLIDAHGLSGALFTRQPTVSWITAGLEDVIIRNADPGFVWALVLPDTALLVTQNIEARRVEAEEHPGDLGFELVEVPWQEEPFDSRIAAICDPERLANDGFGPGRPMTAELQRLRLSLTAGERDRYDGLGRDACAALESSLRTVEHGISERELAARVVAALERHSILPSVLLVGADDRHMQFRHPSVSDASIKREVLAVIVGVRGGLHIAATRTASLARPDATLLERHRAACETEARMIAATRPGASYGDALQAGIEAYERLGYHDEWRHHYQGGPIGYGPREFGPAPLAQPNAFTTYAVELHQACAWNPTVQGAKSEDTFLVEEAGNRVLTVSDTWPTIAVETDDGPVTRPAILELA
jgi:Xaa-Pro dipeptidase